MRIWVCNFLLLMSCATDTLTPYCPTECYEGSDETKNIGTCRTGSPICDEDVHVIECRGQILPSEEICDTEDNDCDGDVDEDLIRDRIVDEDFSCLQSGVCNSVNKQYCDHGQWICNYPNFYEINETLCDGKDNDCDGSVDENLFQGEFCYEGPVGTEFSSPCHPGALKCQFGTIICDNQVLPTSEICDNVDNNCNGLVDDTPTSATAKYDVVIALDTSGSMCFGTNRLYALIQALRWWFNDLQIDVQFAIVDFSALYAPFSRLEVIADFADKITIGTILSYMSSCTGSGDEAAYDSAYDVCNLSENKLNLSWRPDALPMYLSFTDEIAESFYPVSAGITENSVARMCALNAIPVFQWTTYLSDFDYVCELTNGDCFYLSGSSTIIYNDLSSIKFEDRICE